MIEIFNPFGRIDLITEQYLSAINAFKSKNFNKREVSNTTLAIIMMMQYLNCSVVLYKLNEMTKVISDDEFEQLLLTNSIYSKIKNKKNLSKEELRQKFKNCLAHANLLLYFDNNNPTLTSEYYINNDYIECSIPPYFINTLIARIVDRTHIAHKNVDLKVDKIKTIEDLKRFVSGIQLVCFEKTGYSNEKNVTYDNSVAVHNKNFNDLLKSANKYSEDEKCSVKITEKKLNFNKLQLETAFNLIRIFGLKKFNDLSLNDKLHMLSHIYKNNKLEFPDYNGYITSYIMKLFPKDGVLHTEEEFMLPVFYLNGVESLLGYTMCYLREINEKSNCKFFELKDFNYNDINCIDKLGNKIPIKDYLLDKKIIRETDPLFDIKDKMLKIDKEIKNLESEKERREKLESQINNPKDKRPAKIKNEIKTSNQKFLVEYNLKYNDLLIEYKALENEYNMKNSSEEYKPYLNSRNFFRHLRNSISHGKIKYDLSTVNMLNNMGDTVITLYDDMEPKDYFELKITCEDLLRLIKRYKRQVVDELGDLSRETAFYYDNNTKPRKATTRFEYDALIKPKKKKDMMKNPVIESVLKDTSLVQPVKVDYLDVVKSTFDKTKRRIKLCSVYSKFCQKRVRELMNSNENLKISDIKRIVQYEWIEIMKKVDGESIYNAVEEDYKKSMW